MAAFVTDSGLANITAAWNAYASRARYIGWGVGSGQTVSSTQLANTTGITEPRVAGTTSQTTTNTTNDTYQIVGTLTAAGTRAITEAGVFDNPTAGVMCVYGDFPVINLASGDSIAFTIKVVLDQA